MSCPICQNKSNDLLYTKSRGSKYLENYICKNCGFIYVFPRISESRNEALYKKGEFSEVARKMKTPTLDKYFQSEKTALNRLHHLEMCLPEFFASAPRKALEVGCGTGSFTWLLKSRGINAIGLEPDNNYISKTTERYNIQIIPQLLEELKVGNKYDLISSFHVIEHVPDPLAFLKAIYENLNEEGILFLECPTIDNIYTENIDNFFWDVHINTFSDITLRNVVELSGFEIVNCGHLMGFISIIGKKQGGSKKYKMIKDDPNRIKGIIKGRNSFKYRGRKKIKKYLARILKYIR